MLDTLNKSLFGSENKDVDMGAYVRAAEAIRDAFGCVVIIVHHCGYDDTRPRGHSSLPGAVDAQLAVTRTEEIVTVTVEMMRDGPEDTQVVSAAEVIDVGQDQNGKTLTSLVIVPSEATPPAEHRGWPRGLTVFHAALKAALAAHGQAFQPEAGVLPVRAVDQWMVRDRFYATYAEAEEDEKKRQAKIQKAFVRAVGDAQSRGVAKMRRTDTRSDHDLAASKRGNAVGSPDIRTAGQTRTFLMSVRVCLGPNVRLCLGCPGNVRLMSGGNLINDADVPE